MARFYLEEPTLKRKEEAREYIEEHFNYNSNINGTGGLDKEYLNYEEWLDKKELILKPETCPLNWCPAYTYFLIREDDDKIIGMMDIRYQLNDVLLQSGGHIGYGIRPSERRKGYNKINLYLGLLKCRELGLEKVLLTALDNNIGSCKTIRSFDGILENKILVDGENSLMGRYWIDVNKSLETYYDKFASYIVDEKKDKSF